MLLARAYAATRRDAEAAAVFSAAMQHTSTPEMLCSYAGFLATQNRKEEAREWLNRLEETKRTAPASCNARSAPGSTRGRRCANSSVLLRKRLRTPQLDQRDLDLGPRNHKVAPASKGR